MGERLSNTRRSQRQYGTYLGIVKKNEDAQHMGRCSVWIPDFGGDPDSEANWYVVSYAAPFAGSTPVRNNRKNGSDQESTQTSYGFWMQPPDLDNVVLVTFVNGDLSQGFWFACVYQQNMNHSVPGIACNVSTDQSVNDQGIPPTVEYNKKGDLNPDNPRRPVFEPLYNGLANQGLAKDTERGQSSTGARRETPSKAFGYSTPRGTQMTIDDNPENEMIRLRTRGGAQVIVHETSGYVYINSKNGNSWIEISDEGIDVYSKKSISVRAAQDLNFRADRDVFIEGERGVFIRAGMTMTTESGQNTHMKSGTDFKIGSGATFQVKSTGTLNMDSGGNLTMKASGQMLRTASQLHDNGPSAPSVTAPEVKATGERTVSQPTVPASAASAAASTISANVTDGVSAAQKVSEAAGITAPALDAVATGATTSGLPDLSSKASSLSDQVKKLGATAQNLQTEATKVQTRVSGAVGQLTSAINTAKSQASQVVGQVKGAVVQASSVANQVKSTTTSLSGAVTSLEKIGGTKGHDLSSKISGVVGDINTVAGVANKARGEITSIVGQAGSVANQAKAIGDQFKSVKSVAGAATAIGRVQGINAAGIGAVNNARAALGNVLTDAQKIGNQMSAVGNHAEKVAGQITEMVANAPAQITSQVKGELSARAGQLNAAATSLKASGASLIANATKTQSAMAPEAATKTITERMPSHEPWQWHPKEGQQSSGSASSPAEQKTSAIQSAGARSGMSVANGTVPSPIKAVETITTGTGKITKEITAKASSFTQLAGHLVPTNVISAVREAASVAKVDAGYLMAKASEMNFNNLSGLAGTVGLMQMSGGVFRDMVSKYGAQLGVGVNDIHDPRANVLMGAMMTGENATYLADRGNATGATEMKMAHLMGPPVASQFLTNLARDSNLPAYASVPEDFSRTHRDIFYNGDGTARSLGSVYGSFSSRISGKAQNFSTAIAKVASATTQPVDPFPPSFFT